MEVAIVIIVVGGLYFGIYKIAKSKNRQPINWILLSLLISPYSIDYYFSLYAETSKTKRANYNKKE